MKDPVETNVRPGAAGDEAGLANVHIHAWQQSYRGQIPQEILDALPLSFGQRLRWWTSVLAGKTKTQVFVADSTAHGIVGFCAVEPARDEVYASYGEITAIYCLNEYKGKGIGAKLFRMGQTHLSQLGCSSQYLWVLKDNPTKAFYARMGGTEQPGEKVIQLGKPLVEVAFTFSTGHKGQTD